MAGNNGLGVKVRTVEEDSQSWMGLAQEVKAVEEEIKALATSSRQRLFRAVDEEMRRVLREAMPRPLDVSEQELLPWAWEASEAPPLEAMQEAMQLGDKADKPQGGSEQAPVPEVDVNVHEEREAAASLNGHESSPAMATLEVATEGPPPNGGETYSGTVQLVVAVEQSAIQALQFVDALCRHPSMRLQRLLGTAKGRMDMWVLLREPMHLKEALLGMEGVSKVNTIPAEGRQDDGVHLEVRLKEPEAAHGS